MTDSDKQALLNGSATVQTQIEIHNRNLFEIDDFIQKPDGINVSNNTIIMGNVTYQPIVYVFNVTNNKSYTISFNSSTTKIYRMQVKASDSSGTAGTVLLNGSITSLAYSDSFTATSEYIRIEFFQSTSTDEQVISNIRIEEGTATVLTENNSVVDWNHEDFRQVKEEGFIGQFVARQLTGTFRNLGDNFKITDKELLLKLGVRTNDNTNWYSLGNFLVTKVTDDEVNDKTKYEALDYTKLFNKAYVNRLNYPCTALDLAKDVCSQCGVELGNTNFKNNNYSISGNPFTNNESCRDVMKAIGKLAFSWVRVDWDNKVYIDFDSSPFRNLFDGELESGDLNSANGNNETNNNRVRTTNFIEVKSSTKYLISTNVSIGRIIQYDINKNFIRYDSGSNNPLTTTATTKYIRFSLLTTDTTTNVLYNQQPSEYETFGNNKYYNLKTQKEVYGPVDKVVIGYSAIDGERTYIGDENGKCVITVYDNPLVFNQEQRASIINSASDLLGMTYTPLNTQTVGHPWLKGNELVRVSDMEGVSHDTISLDRTIQYFGHIKTVINSTTSTKTNNNLSYKAEMVKNYERSEIYNDQINKEIGAIIEQQTETTNKLNQTISTLDGTIQRVERTETIVDDITTTTQNSLGGNSLYLEDAMQGNTINYSVDGASEQDSYTGRNLYNYKNTSVVSTGVSADEDGWITCSYDNTSGSSTVYLNYFTNNLNLNTNTQYNIITEIKNVTGTGSLCVCSYYSNQGQFNSAQDRNFSTLTNNSIINATKTTKSSFDNVQNGLRTFAYFSAGQKGSVTFRISVLADTTVTPETFIYEPYVGGIPSPNPSYPQDIKNIPSVINLFDNNTIAVVNVDSIEETIPTGKKITCTKAEENKLARYKVLDVSNYVGKTFTVRTYAKSSASNYGFLHLGLGSNSGVISGSVRTSSKTLDGYLTANITIPSTITDSNRYLILSLYGCRDSTPAIGDYVDYTNIMLEEGTITHDYVPYGHYTRIKINGKNLFDKENINWYRTNSSNYYDTSNSSTNRIRTNGFAINGGKTYTISGIPNGITLNSAGPKCYDVNQNYLGDSYISYNGNSFTLPNNVKYIAFLFNGSNFTNDTNTLMKNADIQLEEGNTPTTYESYKEKEVLIDMSKPNLFDNEKEEGNISTSDGSNTPASNAWRSTNYIQVDNESNTLSIENVTFSGTVGRLYFYNESKTYLSNVLMDKLPYKFNIPTNTKYVRFFILTSVANINSNVYVYEGSTPYYELCKIGDYKDTLNIDANGNVVMNKNITKVLLNGTEDISYVSGNSDANYSQFNFRTVNGWKNSNTGSNGSLFKSQYFDYYEGAASPNKTKSGLRIWGNNPKIVCSFPTSLLTSGSELSSFKTWLSTYNTDFYYVLATPETITLPNTKIPLFDGINHVTLVDDLDTTTSVTYYRNTPLSSTYATVQQLNDVSVEKTQEIRTVRQEAMTEINNESVRIDIVRQEIDETGVPILNTGTGYRFDIDGLKMEKTDQDVKSQLDNDGLSVKYKNEDVLTARSNGVNAVNMTVNKFYIQKPIRMEKTKASSDGTSVGLGFFYIGE